MLSFHVTSRLHGYISTPNPAFTVIGLVISLGRDKMLGTSGGGPPTPELPLFHLKTRRQRQRECIAAARA